MELSKEMLVDIVINIINILVLFFVVRALVYKPVKKYMPKRAEKIADKAKAAEELAATTQKKIEECDALASQSKKAMEKAVSDGEKQGREEAAKIIGDAENEANRIIDEAKAEALEERKKLLEDAEDEIVSLALEASEKILKRDVNDEDNRKFVKNFLGEKEEGTQNNA